MLPLIKFSTGRILGFVYPEYPDIVVPSDTKPVNNKVTKWLHPAVIVGSANKVPKPRFKDVLYQIVPATTYHPDHECWAKNQKLYPRIKKRPGGFSADSIILLDQIMTLDLNYWFLTKPSPVDVAGYGVLNQAEMKIIMDGMLAYYQAQTYTHLSPT